MVPTQQGVQDNLHARVYATLHVEGIGKGYSIWRYQVGSIYHSWGNALACDDLILGNMGLQ